MIKKTLIPILFLFLNFSLKANILSAEAKISLITIAPGEDLYSSFGHSAFWVYDPKTGIDRIYNYGTFDFNEPGFYLKFVRGKLLYRLSVSEMEWLMYGAKHENRGVIEQVLNLDPATKESLFQFLEYNYLPENRAYKYDFFFDNCSTRLRDALKKVYGEKLEFHLKVEEEKSFKELLDPFLLNKQWQDMGMDIGLGMPADRIATSYDYMFLPEFLMKGFESATIRSNGKTTPLVKNTKVLFNSDVPSNSGLKISPSVVFWILSALTIGLTFFQYRSKNKSYLFDYFLLLVTGVLGLVIVFLWLGTDHYVTRNNWNIIWANPLNVFISIFLMKKKYNKVVEKYFLLYGIATLLLLIFWKVIPQQLNYHTFPLILILSSRAFFIYYQFRTQRSLINNIS